MSPAEAIALLSRFGSSIGDDLAALIGEQAILLSQDLTGPEPNTFTPRLTGNLALSAKVSHSGTDMFFLNDASPYVLAPGQGGVRESGGQPQIADYLTDKESYASYVHGGLYEADALEAFELRMIEELAIVVERFVEARLNV
jgi:hypothetical protein